MGIYDTVQNFVQGLVWGGIDDNERAKMIERKREYRKGIQAQQIEVKHGANDNITVNFVGLVVDRAVTMLFGNGVEFDMPGEGETPQDELIRGTWDANKQEILLHKIATLGAESGTCFVKLLPDGIRGRDGNLYVRLVALDPKMCEIETLPSDIEYVVKYIIKWKDRKDGKEVRRKQEIKRGADEAGIANDTWLIEDYWQKTNSNQWNLERSEVWAYDFPPVMHWQNLPSPLSPYGQADITEDVIVLQDRLNFVASNMSKIIRYHAHPQTVVSGANASDIAVEPGKALFLPGENGKAYNIEMQSDLASSFNFLQFLRQALFSITQSVDVSSFADKIGALTNFGLRVLYMDALSRLHTKQELYGDALVEINRRILVLSGDTNADGGAVVWKDILPQSETEETQALEADLRMGIVSKKTVAVARGYDWDEEQERMAEEQQSQDNVGAAILRAFTQGRQ